MRVFEYNRHFRLPVPFIAVEVEPNHALCFDMEGKPLFVKLGKHEEVIIFPTNHSGRKELELDDAPDWVFPVLMKHALTRQTKNQWGG